MGDDVLFKLLYGFHSPEHNFLNFCVILPRKKWFLRVDTEVMKINFICEKNCLFTARYNSEIHPLENSFFLAMMIHPLYCCGFASMCKHNSEKFYLLERWSSSNWKCIRFLTCSAAVLTFRWQCIRDKLLKSLKKKGKKMFILDLFDYLYHNCVNTRITPSSFYCENCFQRNSKRPQKMLNQLTRQ